MNSPIVSFGDVATIERHAANREECLQLPYVGLDDIESNAGEFTPMFRRKPESLLATKFRFASNHILYGKLRPYLNKVTTPTFDGVCSTEILPLRPDERYVDRDFLYGLLLSPHFVSWASAQVSGANLPRLDPGRLEEFRFPLPSLAEQRAIGALIRKTIRLRRMRRCALEMSEGLLGTVFLEMFGDPLANPKGFELRQIAELSSVPPTLGTIRVCTESGTYLCIRVGEIGDGEVKLAGCGRVSLSPSELKRFSAEPGDLLLARAIGSEDHLGKLSVVQESVEPLVFDSHVMRVRLDTSKVSPAFLATLLWTPGGRKLFVRSSRRTAVQFNCEQMSELALPIPSTQLQRTFTGVAASVSRLMSTSSEALRQAEHVFQTLLHKAFGED
jgi:type I restriction enzyme S subunit